MCNIVVSEVFGGPYCRSNVNSWRETYAVNLAFM